MTNVKITTPAEFAAPPDLTASRPHVVDNICRHMERRLMAGCMTLILPGYDRTYGESLSAAERYRAAGWVVEVSRSPQGLVITLSQPRPADPGDGSPSGVVGRHCDSYIHDLSQPLCLRFWLLVNRLPASDMELMNRAGVNPKLFATTTVSTMCGWSDGKVHPPRGMPPGTTVRLVTASCLGDVGITSAIDRDVYEDRVGLELLSNFRESP